MSTGRSSNVKDGFLEAFGLLCRADNIFIVKAHAGQQQSGTATTPTGTQHSSVLAASLPMSDMRHS